MNITWKPKARKQLRKLPADRQQQIYNAICALEEMPDVSADVKKKKGTKDIYRLRVGRYRVIFGFYESIQIVEIQEVKKRDERTY
jgi:mRNA-degrading endonuclease RelE of RelBE toxin-antitoxin system